MPDDWLHDMQTAKRHPPAPTTHLHALALRTLMLAAVWWALTEGDGGWGFGLLLALLVSALSLLHTPPAANVPRLHRVPGFVAYFLMQSLLAGFDVARRILHPRLPLNPRLVRVPLRLPAGAPTWSLMILISLLPGTLSAQLDAAELELHCLDMDGNVLAEVRKAEVQLARLFGVELADLAETDA